MAGGFRQSDAMSPVVPMAAGAIFIVLASFYLLVHGNTSLLLALVVLTVILSVYLVSKTMALYLMLIFLLLLGDIRRVWSWIFGFPSNDPLIIVGSLFTLIVAVPILFRVKVPDTVSKCCLGLLIVMVLQIFNPAQGGLLVGLSGMIYIMTPVLWFWIGRTYGTEAVFRTLLYRVLLPLALLGSAYGYYQNTVGFPPWQKAWLDHVGTTFAALHLGSSIRAIGFSASSSEYVNMLGMATTVALCGLLSGRRIMALPLAVLLPSLFLGGSRGTFVRVLFSGAVAYSLAGAKKGASTIRFVSAITLGIGGLALILSGFGNNGNTDAMPTSATDIAIRHQLRGLSDSSASGHVSEIIRGAILAAQRPAGHGLGSTSIAAKFSEGGDSGAVASEFDLTDTFIALGLPGGLLYLGFIVFLYRDSYRYITIGPRDLSLPIFGILAAFLGDWLFPGEYPNGPILWMAAGCVVRAVVQNRAEIAEEQEITVEADVPALVTA